MTQPIDEFPMWYPLAVEETDELGRELGGIAIIQELPGQGDDDLGEPVAFLYDIKGPLWNAERNALAIAAAPQLLQACLNLVRIFHKPAQSMGPEYVEAVGRGHAAIRLTLNAEEQAAELDSLAARINGQLQ